MVSSHGRISCRGSNGLAGIQGPGKTPPGRQGFHDIPEKADFGEAGTLWRGFMSEVTHGEQFLILAGLICLGCVGLSFGVLIGWMIWG